MYAESFFIAGVSFISLLCNSAHATGSDPNIATTAIPALTFLGSLGVITKVDQGYNYQNYIPALKYTGIQNVRDGISNLPNLITMHNQTGIQVDILDSGDLQGLLSAGRTLAAAGALLSFEGPNEPNNFPITYNGQVGGGSGTWVPVAQFQRDIYAGVQGDRVLKNYPVFHVSEGGAEVDNVGMQWLTIPTGSGSVMPTGTQYADYANTHNYVSGKCHTYVDNVAWQAKMADLATDELVEKKRIEPRRRSEDAPKRPEHKGGILAVYGLSDEQGNEIIMAARAHWFEDEEPAGSAAAEEDAHADSGQ